MIMRPHGFLEKITLNFEHLDEGNGHDLHAVLKPVIMTLSFPSLVVGECLP